MPFYVDVLPCHVRRSHVDSAGHVHQGTDRSGGHTVLPGTGLGNDTRFALPCTRICPMALLILWAPVWLRRSSVSSRVYNVFSLSQSPCMVGGAAYIIFQQRNGILCGILRSQGWEDMPYANLLRFYTESRGRMRRRNYRNSLLHLHDKFFIFICIFGSLFVRKRYKERPAVSTTGLHVSFRVNVDNTYKACSSRLFRFLSCAYQYVFLFENMCFSLLNSCFRLQIYVESLNWQIKSRFFRLEVKNSWNGIRWQHCFLSGDISSRLIILDGNGYSSTVKSYALTSPYWLTGFWKIRNVFPGEERCERCHGKA